VISEEIRIQLMEKTGRDFPDYLLACVGGGSNAAGAYYHYLENPAVRLISAEAAGLGVDSGKTAATSVLGTAGIIHGSRTLLMQDGDGQIQEPYSISAGLDYPGVGPLHAWLAESGRATVFALTDDEALQAAMLCTRMEGIIPALETAHALAALEKISPGPGDVVVVNLSGRGDKDMEIYIDKLKI
jgi:tryptophan synthase beta chain